MKVKTTLKKAEKNKVIILLLSPENMKGTHSLGKVKVKTQIAFTKSLHTGPCTIAIQK